MTSKINRSRKLVVAIMLLTGSIMFLFNHFTLMLVDDYAYCFSFEDGSRIVSVSQIIPSMLAHYHTMNGRLIVHSIVQILVMLPAVVFDIINAGVYCLLCYTLYDYIWKMHHNEHNALMLATIISALWIFVPSYGEVFLWLDGSCNYLWSVTFLLLFLKPALMGWPYRKKPLFWCLYIAVGFVLGGVLESVSFAVICFFPLSMFVRKIIFHEKAKLWQIIPSISMLPGYIFMMRSPGTKAHKIEMTGIGSKFVNVFIQYTSTFRWLLILGVILSVFLLLFGIKKDHLWSTMIWFCLSFGMNCMYSISTYYPQRSMIGMAVFLIVADGILVEALWNCDNRGPGIILNCFVCSICVIIIFQGIISFVPGTYDIYQEWKQIKKNEIKILREVEAGNQNVAIEAIQTSTFYAASHGLKYVDTETYNTWPNQSMAKFYGIEAIIGSN